MTINLKLKPALFFIALTYSQFVFAQPAQSGATLQPLLTNSVQEAKPANKARVIIEWAVWDFAFGLTTTEISVDKSVVCKLKEENAKICDIRKPSLLARVFSRDFAENCKSFRCSGRATVIARCKA